MHDERMHDHILAGFDGSGAAAAAARWAADEAERRHAGLTILGCYAVPIVTDYGIAAGTLVTADLDAIATATRRGLDEITTRLAESHPALAVNAAAVQGGASSVLVEQAAHADLLVVGSTGAGEAASWLFGSVAHAVARSSPCPVALVTREHTTSEHPRVVVGVGEFERSLTALDWAIDEADILGGELTVVHAWSYPYGTETAMARDFIRVDAATEMDRSVEHARLRGGGMVEGRLAEADAADELVAAAEDADVLVVGTRGRGGLRSILFGSVSSEVICRAPCPIVVVR
jgi:nucleotide-binding universal stress UspA family protein